MTDDRTNNGKVPTVEDTTTSDDAWDVLLRLAGSGMVYDFGRPTSQQAALVSVVTGAMTGAFAVWMGHEK